MIQLTVTLKRKMKRQRPVKNKVASLQNVGHREHI